MPWAEAVAIRQGRIIAVGKARDVARRRGRDTRIVDLDGKLLLPGFGDLHAHPVFGGIAFSRCSLHNQTTIKAYQDTIAKCVAATPGTGPIYGVGWGEAQFPPSGNPRKEVLDQVSATRPLIFESVGGHSYWLNSAALAAAGITKDTPNPPNGVIDRDPTTGEPSGSLQESAMDLAKHLVPVPSPAEVEGSILYVNRHFNSLGITSWHDAGIEVGADGKSGTLEAYQALARAGKLSAHVTIALKWANERSIEQTDTLLRVARSAPAGDVRITAVKFYVDGVIPQKTALMIDPYEASGHDHGQSQIAPGVLNEAIARIEAQGLQSHAHAIGDGATRLALDGFAISAKRNPRADRRPMISHLNVIDPVDQPRFGALGVIAVFQPLWASNYGYMDLAKQAIGQRRSQLIYPANSVLKGGGMLAYGADWPVGSANPLQGLQVAVTRTNFDDPASGPLLPGEAITLPQAVRAYTINVAYANRMERETGSIKVGKSADLVVLDQNIFAIAPDQIAKTKVLMTLYKGRVVYDGASASASGRQ